MKAKKTGKTARARRATKDLPLAGRVASGNVKGGQKVEDNVAQKERIRKAQEAFE